ncbi:MAG: sigma-70 family RNA polymerase sigma factor [Chloroflexi bacterium]|nr:sigma-70 family RNA polymerase sigma factor [Chloroflexota bacterium]
MMQNLADTQTVTCIIERARQGDTEAYGELYECHRLGIFRYLYYRTGDTQVADDLTSEVFLRMIQALPGFEQREVGFQAWLFQIAQNILNDHYRKMSVRNDVQLEDTILDNHQTLARSRPVERTLNSVTLNQAINRLSGEQRDVIVLRFISGMPISQVAQTLNKSEDAVKGLQRRALMTLREVLSDWEIHYA